jgi:uncharacterized repeat protein (TIGR04138 family)
MPVKNFEEVIHLICREDRRYDPGAYIFMRQALDFTLTGIREKEKTTQHRHITGQELCEGIRDYTLEKYGPMGWTLLKVWGINATEDFGQIVFNLVEYGIFGKTETDRIEDFEAVYDFQKTFVDPFRPTGNFLKSCKNPNGQGN